MIRVIKVPIKRGNSVMTRYNCVREGKKGERRKLDELIQLSVPENNLSGVPNEIKILPLGTVTSRKGTFLVDDKSVNLILKNFKERKIDLVVDYEHQTLLNVQAPAGGWITELYKGTDAIIAKVEWTQKAQEYLKNREYRYLSPAIRAQKDGRVSSIQSVALTNTPAIDGMFAMCKDAENRETERGEKKMDLKKLIAILGLPEETTEAEVENAVKDIVQKTTKNENKPQDTGAEGVVANSTVLSLLELPLNASTADVTSKIMALKNGDVELAMRVKQLEDAARKRETDILVETALKSGKIAAAQKDWAKEYALSDRSGFEKFLQMTPAAVPMGKMKLKDAKETPERSAEMMAILKNTGISEEDFDKYADKEVTL